MSTTNTLHKYIFADTTAIDWDAIIEEAESLSFDDDVNATILFLDAYFHHHPRSVNGGKYTKVASVFGDDDGCLDSWLIIDPFNGWPEDRTEELREQLHAVWGNDVDTPMREIAVRDIKRLRSWLDGSKDFPQTHYEAWGFGDSITVVGNGALVTIEEEGSGCYAPSGDSEIGYLKYGVTHSAWRTLLRLRYLGLLDDVAEYA